MLGNCISKDHACIVGSECKSFNVLFEKTVYRRIPFVYLRRLYCKPCVVPNLLKKTVYHSSGDVPGNVSASLTCPSTRGVIIKLWSAGVPEGLVINFCF